ncbi:MAG: carboxypeptidase-like regulatory domain-containing protein, partial [Bacteroidota bacterium]
MKEAKVRWASVSLVVIFLLGLVAISAYGQSATLRGTVTDAETGESLPGANIIVSSARVETGAAADAKGQFVLRGLLPGTYTVTVSYIGYAKEVMSNVEFAAGETKSLDISLSPTGIQV